MELGLQLPDEVVEAIARRAAELVLEQLDELAASRSDWLSIEEAAAFLRCQPKRIYDLRTSGRLTRHVEGGRALVARAELVGLVVDLDGRGPGVRRAA